MNDVPISTFEQAIKAAHGASARVIERVHVEERFGGEPIWEGEVLVFELLDHPSASRCYAWEVNGEVTAVLGGGTVDSPIAGVRAAILASDFAARQEKRR
ncbi:MAG TPA: hypothetical protein DEP35_16200 [Deltaproteobacteria bacterium]|jgi:hypothetical protein|nr:hypothetical protein [Deltaproteobacteria bacterium]